MASVNKVILIGNLGRDPELKQTANSAVCEFSLATTDRWFDKASNSQKERTEWHRVIVWGRQGENVAKYLRKGSSAYVEGRLQTREWQDKDGNKRWTTEVVAQGVRFLGGRDDGGGRDERDDGAPSFGGDDAPGGFDDGEIPFGPIPGWV